MGSMFNDLLSFHKPPTYPIGAEYWINHIVQLHRLDLQWDTPTYPKEWFAGRWERTAINLVKTLVRNNVPVSSETVADAYKEAAGEAP